MRRVGIIWLCMLTLIGPVLISYGTYSIISQNQKLKQCKAVQATILSSEIERIESNGPGNDYEVTYRPQIRYVYSVNDVKYESCNVLVYKKRSGESWSRKMIRQFRSNQTVTAYYLPHNPSESFLLKESVFLGAYDLFLAGMAAVIWMVLLDLLMYADDRSYVPIRIRGNRFKLKCELAIITRFKVSLALTLFWYISMIWVFAYYFLTASRPYELKAQILALIYGIIGLVLVGITFHYQKILRSIKDAEIFVDSEYFTLGKTYILQVSQSKSFLGALQDCYLNLVCEKKKGLKNDGWKAEKDYDAIISIPKKQLLTDKVNGDVSIKFPEGKNPTSPSCYLRENQVRYDWYLHLTTKVESAPIYRMKYPIIVK